MNEWSPGGNYSRPGTPSQTGRSFRSQWDESEKGTKPLIVNARGVAETISRSFQQHSMENVSSFITPSNKPKKGVTGTSDPRFKRVISPGVQSDASIGAEVKIQNNSPVQDKEALKPKEKERVGDLTELKGGKPFGDSLENTEKPKIRPEVNEQGECENLSPVQPCNYDQSQDHLKAVDKLAFNHDILVKSFSKESLSDCTVNTRNTSLASEDLVDEFPNDVSVCPSAMRVKKVQNWIQNHKTKPEKKQSVITVIGQTQEQEDLCSALREIGKRKKLVKELDKYALCKKITDTGKDKEISELMAKINFLSNVGKIIFSQKKRGDGNDTAKESSKQVDIQGNDKIPSSRDDPASQNFLTGKRSSTRKKTKRSQSECIVKGIIRELFSRLQYHGVLWLLILMSVALCLLTFHSIENGAYLSLDLFSEKPKPLTWYEKICMWIWEIFRPSNNYQRMAPWHAY